MLKKTITFEDYNGEKHTESFYFHLTKPELLELELDYDGGLSGAINTIVETNDNKQLVATFKRIIALSYGVKSADGKRFTKSEDIRSDFLDSAAYVELFMQLATDADAAAEFIKGLMPADMAADIEKAEAKLEASNVAEIESTPETNT